MKLENFTEANDKSRAMSAAVVSGSQNPAVIKQADAGSKQMKAIDQQSKAETKLVDAKEKEKLDPNSANAKAVKDARDRLQVEKKKVQIGQKALEDSKKKILNSTDSTTMSTDQMKAAKAKQDALKEKTTKFFSGGNMDKVKYLDFIKNKINNFSELAEDEKVKQSVEDLSNAVNSDDLNEVPRAADNVISAVENKCVTFSDRCAASDIIKALRLFSEDDSGADVSSMVDQGKVSEPDDSSIPSEAKMDNNKVENFSKKLPANPSFAAKAGKIMKDALSKVGEKYDHLTYAEALIRKYPTGPKLAAYLKKRYAIKSRIPWTSLSKWVKKFEMIRDDDRSTYRSQVYRFTNTSFGLAALYESVPTFQGFMEGISDYKNNMKKLNDQITDLKGDNMEFSETDFADEAPADPAPATEGTDKPTREKFFKRVGNWFKNLGENAAKTKAVKWIKDNPAEAAAIGVTAATITSFLVLNGKIGALKERLKTTDNPDERAEIKKKLNKMKIFLTAMVIGTATSGAIAGRAQLKKNPDSWLSKKLKMKPFENFEDEVGEGEDEDDENDPGDDAAPTDAEDPAPKVDTEEKDFDYDFEDEDTDGGDEDKGDETPSEVTPVEDDPESAKKVEDIKDAEVAMGPGKLAEFSKNLRRFCSDPTNVELRRSVLSQFSEAMDEAVYDKHFADFDQFAEDQAQPAAQSAPAPAVVPPAPAPAPAGAPVAPAPAAEPAPAPADPNAAPAPAPAAPAAEGAPADPNAAPAGAAVPADGAAPADPNAAAPADPNAAPAEGQPAQGDGTNESDIVIDKREVQANFSVQDESYGSRMARLARA